MPYTNLVREYSQKNHFKYNHRAIFRQVRAAMRGPLENRERALREILERNFIADAEKYEPKRRELIYDAEGMDPDDNEELLADINRMAGPPKFLEEYTEIINAMARDVDNTYEPKRMLGLDAKDAKRLVDRQLSTYSRYEQCKYGMDSDGWEEALRHVEESRYSRLRNQVRNYATSDENLQGAMKETYIRMKIVQERLDSKFRIWKWIFRAETRAMENFIATAKRALEDVNFPKQAEREAEVEFSFSSALPSAYKLAHQLIDTIYKEAEPQVAPQEEPQEQIDQALPKEDNREIQEASPKEHIVIDFEKESKNRENEIKEAQNGQAKDLSCTEKANNLLADEKFNENLEDELWRVIEKSIPGNQLKTEVMPDIYKVMTQAAQNFNNTYDNLVSTNPSAEEIDETLHENMQSLFFLAYNSLKPLEMSKVDMVVAAQRMSDVVIGKISPVAFNKEQLGKFSSGYALKNPDIVSETLLTSEQDLNEEKCNVIIEHAKDNFERLEKAQVIIIDDNNAIPNEVSERHNDEPKLDNRILK